MGGCRRRPQPIEPLGAEYDARQQRANATCAQADKVIQTFSATQPGASLATDPDLTGPGLCSDQHTGGLAAGSSEDCLYLSIYQPENQAPGETFPVMLVRALAMGGDSCMLAAISWACPQQQINGGNVEMPEF
jgi:hypothetical protein